MIRSFQTHNIRRWQELSGLWSLTPLEGEKKGMVFSAPVPGCWESLPGLERYKGRAVYKTSLEAEGNVRLVIKGASHSARVFFDGGEVGGHYNAYTPFDAVIPGVAGGMHILEVEVNNAYGPDSALHVPNDYYTYGGIIRPVAVERVPGAYIRYVHATPVRRREGWALKLEIRVDCVGEDALRVAPSCVFNGSSCTLEAAEVQPGGFTLFTGELPCPGVGEYEPEAPRLYLLNTTLACDGAVTDDLIERVGFRTVSVEGGQILWNGKPLRIKGFCRHEDHPQFGSALPLPAMAQDLALMRDMGANSVRTSHYPNDELFLDLCDETGLLVWEENHARGLDEEQMHNPNFRRQCADCIDEMLENHFNHPSIYLWGILNECASETEYGRECYAEQLSQIRASDPSRPVSFASCKHFSDICLDLVDVVSYNIYPEWYTDDPAADFLNRLFDWIQKDTPGAGKPFLITETGAGGIYGYRGPHNAMWTEERQAEILGHLLAAFLPHPGVNGVYIWQFCDARVDEEWAMRRPRTMNNKGVVDEYRRPKLSYHTVKKWFDREAQAN